MSAFLNRLRQGDRQLITDIALAVFKKCGFTQFDIEAAYTHASPMLSRMAGPVEKQMAKYRDNAVVLRSIAFSDLDFRVDLEAGSLSTGELTFRVATQVILQAILELIDVNPAFGEEDRSSWAFLGRMPRDVRTLPITIDELSRDDDVSSVDLWADREGWNFIVRYGTGPRSFAAYLIGEDVNLTSPYYREALRRHYLPPALV